MAASHYPDSDQSHCSNCNGSANHIPVSIAEEQATIHAVVRNASHVRKAWTATSMPFSIRQNHGVETLVETRPECDNLRAIWQCHLVDAPPSQEGNRPQRHANHGAKAQRTLLRAQWAATVLDVHGLLSAWAA